MNPRTHEVFNTVAGAVVMHGTLRECDAHVSKVRDRELLVHHLVVRPITVAESMLGKVYEFKWPRRGATMRAVGKVIMQSDEEVEIEHKDGAKYPIILANARWKRVADDAKRGIFVKVVGQCK